MATSIFEAKLQDSLSDIRERIARAAKKSGRDPNDITLVGVTKSYSLDVVYAALASGIFDLGENRVEELIEKSDTVSHKFVRWHMIGHVQGRKSSSLIGVAGLVHSVDSIRLAQRLSKAAEKADKKQPILIQVNTSGEVTKGGFQGDEIERDLKIILGLQGLEVRGLMTMAPFTDDEIILRKTFRSARKIHNKLQQLEEYSGEDLSMGMTNDFEIAIEEGSTMIRLGTALFGKRKV